MPRRENEFSEDDKIKVLLWCARHCCLCGDFAGLLIEVAHLDPTKSDIKNAVPLCFNCHATIDHYNVEHPLGKKYSIRELRARRDQIYEHHTRHLVSPVNYRLFQDGVALPEVRFEITNVGETYPIKAKIRLRLAQGTRNYGFPRTKGHYNGGYVWNLNPQQGVVGIFKIPTKALDNPEEPLRVRVDIDLIDIYDRSHSMLPGGYVRNLKKEAEWYFEPAVEELCARDDEKARVPRVKKRAKQRKVKR